MHSFKSVELLFQPSRKTKQLCFRINVQENTVLGLMCKQITFFGHFRILYGRMKNKTGSKNQGKSASCTRMSIVLRFLAGTQPEEIEIFLDLLFEPVKHFRNGRYQLPAAL